LALIKALGLGGLLSEVTEIIQDETMRRDRNIAIAANVNKSGSTKLSKNFI